MSFRRFARYFALAAVGAIFVFASGCSLIEGDDDDGNGNGGSGNGGSNSDVPEGVTVQRIVYSTELGDLPARGIVPSSAREIRAVVTISGVEEGQTVTGTWYQLGVANPGPEGRQAHVRILLPLAGTD